MATCGYVCPKCEGKGFDSNSLLECTWCKVENQINVSNISNKEWIDSVHEGNCCSDPIEHNNKSKSTF